MATIYLFRHGQTDFNKNGIFTGWLEADLTDEGVEECRKVAEQLKDITPTKAYTSDMGRAHRTLYLVLGDKRPEVLVDTRLRERNYGDLNGKSKAETKLKHPKEFPLWHRSYDVAPPNGESIKDVERRVLPFIDEMLSSLKKDDIVFISAHSNSIRPIRRFFEKISIEEMCSFEPTPAKIYRYVV